MDTDRLSKAWPLPAEVGEPDFDNLLAVLRREKPSRATLFEFFRNPRIDARLAGYPLIEAGPDANTQQFIVDSFYRCGYALGSGNSIPDYIPDEGCLAMVRAAPDARHAASGMGETVGREA